MLFAVGSKFQALSGMVAALANAKVLISNGALVDADAAAEISTCAETDISREAAVTPAAVVLKMVDVGVDVKVMDIEELVAATCAAPTDVIEDAEKLDEDEDDAAEETLVARSLVVAAAALLKMLFVEVVDVSTSVIPAVATAAAGDTRVMRVVPVDTAVAVMEKLLAIWKRDIGHMQLHAHSSAMDAMLAMLTAAVYCHI